MSLTIHGAGAEFALGLAEGVGTVSTEGRTYGLQDSDVVRSGLLAEAAGGKEEGGKRKKEERE
jgi:hypothetical protein